MASLHVTRPAPLAGRPRRPIANALAVTGGIVAALMGLGWTGLQIPPAPFPAVPQPASELATTPLPDGLPAPVAHFYHQVYGSNIPVITSAVISGRGTLRPFGGVTFPARFRFTHEAGQSYRHYFEATLFGLPLMKVNEYYVGGVGRMEMPWGVEQGAQINQGANLSLWAEILFGMPAALLTDPNVSWQPVDDATAVLVVPFGKAHERFVVRFDPASGRPWLIESMRYKGAAATEKTLWLNELRAWGILGGYTLPTSTAVTWGDDGTPWLELTVEDVTYNVPVDTSTAAKGP